MKSPLVLCAMLVATTAAAAFGATAKEGDPIVAAGAAAKWTTVYRSPLAIEGLTGDHQGNLYVAQRGGSIGCPILRIRPPQTMQKRASGRVGRTPARRPACPLLLSFIVFRVGSRDARGVRPWENRPPPRR